MISAVCMIAAKKSERGGSAGGCVGEGALNALLRHRVRRTELLGEEAHAQLLDHPADAGELRPRLASGWQRRERLVVGLLHELDPPHELPVALGPLGQR